MIVKATLPFLKMRDKLVSKNKISLQDYQNTLNKFKINPKDKSLNPHKINCKKGISIISIIVKDNSYKILVNQKDCTDLVFVFSWIGSHREYERIIKDKKNCKSIFIDCSSIKELDSED